MLINILILWGMYLINIILISSIYVANINFCRICIFEKILSLRLFTTIREYKARKYNGCYRASVNYLASPLVPNWRTSLPYNSKVQHISEIRSIAIMNLYPSLYEKRFLFTIHIWIFINLIFLKSYYSNFLDNQNA